MKKNAPYIIIAVLVIALIGYWAYNTSVKQNAKNNTEQVTPLDPNTTNTTNTPPTNNAVTPSSPCADVEMYKTDLIEKQSLAKTAVKEANDAYQRYIDAINDCNDASAVVNGRLKLSVNGGQSTQTQVTRSPSTTTVKSTTVTSGQNVSSNYQAAPARSVSTSVIEGASRKETFCVNLSNMNPDSFWPQKAADNGDQIENSVLNSTADGLNISIYPVAEISGLYGVTKDKRVFILATLLDKYSPDANGIVVGGSPNGWKNWVHVERVGDYYIAQF